MKNKSIQKVLNNSNFKSYSGLILVIIVVSVFMSIRSENFMTPTNILNVLRQISVYGILACGMAFAMMTGGIDLTVALRCLYCHDRNPALYHDPGHADYPAGGMLPDL